MRKVRKEVWVLLASTLALGAIWLVTTPSIWRRFSQPKIQISEATVDHIAISPDGSKIAVFGSTTSPTGANTSRLEVWDVPSRKLLWSKGAGYSTSSFSPDGRFLVDFDPGFRISRFYDSRSGQIEPKLPLKLIVAWHDTSQAIEYSQSQLRFWDTHTGWVTASVLLSPPPRLPDFHTPIWYEVVFSPQRRYVMAMGFQRRRVWRRNNETPFVTGPLRIWDLQSGKVAASLGAKNLWKVEFGADDQTLLIAESQKVTVGVRSVNLKWWNWKERRVIRTLPSGEISYFYVQRKGNYLLCFRKVSSSSRLSKDAICEWKAYGLRDGRRLWNVIVPSTDWIRIEFSEDGALFCAPEWNKETKVYDCVVRSGKTGDELARFSNARYLALTPDGRTLACGETDGGLAGTRHDIVRIYDLSHLKP